MVKSPLRRRAEPDRAQLRMTASQMITEVAEHGRLDRANTGRLFEQYGMATLFAEVVKLAAQLSRTVSQQPSQRDFTEVTSIPGLPSADDLDSAEARRDRRQTVLSLMAMSVDDPSVDAPEMTDENVRVLMDSRSSAMLAADSLNFGAGLLREHARTLGVPVGELIRDLRTKAELGLDSM